MMRCLPHPLSLLCWLDNRHGSHDDTIGVACRLHDAGLQLLARLSILRTRA